MQNCIFPYVTEKDFFWWEHIKSSWQENSRIRPRNCPAIYKHMKKWIKAILSITEKSKIFFFFSYSTFSQKFLNNYNLMVHIKVVWYSHLHHQSFSSSLFCIRKGLYSGFLRKFCIHLSHCKICSTVLWYFS